MLLLLACVGKGPESPRPDDSQADTEFQDSPTDSETDTDTSQPDPVDADGDGFAAGDDCDDADPSTYPGAPEGCDGVDRDCDEVVNEGCGSAPTGTFSLSEATPILSTATVSVGLYVGSVGDENADGFADLWVGGQVFDGAGWKWGGWLLQGPLDESVDPEEEWDARRMDSEETFAQSAWNGYGLGDVDGDGLPEVAYASGDVGVGVFVSPVTGDSSADDAELVVPWSADDSLELIGAAGDQNADGVPDLLLTSFGGLPGATAGILFNPALGTVNAGDWDVQLGLIDTDRGLCGVAEGLGDIDGDGIDDIALGDGEDGYYGYCVPGAQAFWVVPGPLDSDVIVSEVGSRFAPGTDDGDDRVYAVKPVPDLDGDGKTDLAVAGSTPDGSAVWLIPGDRGWSLLADIAFATLTSSDDLHDGFTHLEDAHDVNADGFGDLVISGYDLQGNGGEAGGAWIAYGPFAGAVDLVDNGALLLDDSGYGRVGTDVAGVGDTNGDGFDDVLIASTPYALDGRDWLVYGGL